LLYCNAENSKIKLIARDSTGPMATAICLFIALAVGIFIRMLLVMARARKIGIGMFGVNISNFSKHAKKSPIKKKSKSVKKSPKKYTRRSPSRRYPKGAVG
jgi:hypothetical protein